MSLVIEALGREALQEIQIRKEFAVDVRREGELDELEVRVEVRNAEPAAVANALEQGLRNGLGLRAVVRSVEFGTLPRFELKARRFTDHR